MQQEESQRQQVPLKRTFGQFNEDYATVSSEMHLRSDLKDKEQISMNKDGDEEMDQNLLQQFNLPSSFGAKKKSKIEIERLEKTVRHDDKVKQTEKVCK